MVLISAVYHPGRSWDKSGEIGTRGNLNLTLFDDPHDCRKLNGG